MDKINLYNVYQNNYYNKANQTGKSGNADKTEKTKESQGTSAAKESKVELSQAAKDLLKELREKYGNTDFIVANYETDEEAASYLSRGTGAYSVLISPEELEEMAADETKKNENLTLLDEAFAKLDEMKNQLGDKGEEVKRLGIAIGDNGQLSFFAELEKVSEKQRQRIEKAREEKKAEAKEEKAEVAKEKEVKTSKSTLVFASTTEELMQKIATVGWDDIKEKSPEVAGGKFDFTV